MRSSDLRRTRRRPRLCYLSRMLRRAVLLALAALCGLLTMWALWPRAAMGPATGQLAQAPESAASAVDPAASEGIAGPGSPGGRDARITSDRTQLPQQRDDGDATTKSTLPHDPNTIWLEVRDARDQLVADVPVGLRTADTEQPQWRWRGVSGRDGRVRAPNVTTVEGSRDKIGRAHV